MDNVLDYITTAISVVALAIALMAARTAVLARRESTDSTAPTMHPGETRS